MNEKEYYLFVHGDIFQVMIYSKQFSWSEELLTIRSFKSVLEGLPRLQIGTLISCTNWADLYFFVLGETVFK